MTDQSLTDPTRELARFLGFWDEGLGQYRTEREDDEHDERLHARD